MPFIILRPWSDNPYHTANDIVRFLTYLARPSVISNRHTGNSSQTFHFPSYIRSAYLAGKSPAITVLLTSADTVIFMVYRLNARARERPEDAEQRLPIALFKESRSI